MSLFAVILPLLFLAQADAPRAGRMEGTMRVLVEVVVRDRSSGAPVAGASVTFVRRPQAETADDTTRTTVTTDAQGVASLPCIFAASFHYSGSMANIVRWEWRPGGEIQVQHGGYAETAVAPAAAFPAPAYTGTKAPSSVVIELQAR